jgi:hypothetical protein
MRTLALAIIFSLAAVPAFAAITESSVVTATGTASVATVAVTAPAGSVLVALVSAAGPGGSGSQSSSVSGCGISWMLIKRANTRPGVADVFKSATGVPLAGCIVTSRTGNGTAFFVRLTVVVLTGAGAVGTSASASGNKGPVQATLIGLTTGSRVYGVGSDMNLAQIRTVVSGQRKLAESIRTGVGTFWSQASINPVTTTSVVVGTTVPSTRNWNFAAVEILALPVAACVWDVNPTTLSVLAGSGSAPVTVLTSCPWTATSNAAWLSVAPTSGTTTGAVSVSWSANSGVARSGTVTIAGKMVTVNQPAAIIPTLVITCPGVQTRASLTGSPIAVTYPLATTTGGTLPVLVTGSPPSGSLFPVGTSMVTQTASSADGQTVPCTMGVIVTFTPQTTSLCDEPVELTKVVLRGTYKLLTCQPGEATGWKVVVEGSDYTPVVTDVGHPAAAGPPNAAGVTPYYLPLPLPTAGIFKVSSIAYNYNTTDGWAQIGSTNVLTVTVQ